MFLIWENWECITLDLSPELSLMVWHLKFAEKKNVG